MKYTESMGKVTDKFDRLRRPTGVVSTLYSFQDIAAVYELSAYVTKNDCEQSSLSVWMQQ